MAKPLSRVVQIFARPHHKEMVLRNIGLREMLNPFVGFFQFCIGKLLFTVFMITFLDRIIPGFTTKYFTMYVLIGLLMLSPLGLHLFLAYQEFVFYSFCSHYRAFAKLVMESSEVQKKVTTTEPTGTNQTAEQNIIAIYDAPGKTFHGHMEELIDIMKNMTEAFGPFLFQNFSLMLFFWILHIYYVCYVILGLFRNPSELSDLRSVALTIVQIIGGVLIVR